MPVSMESNIILGFCFPYVVGLAFDKMVSSLTYFKEHNHSTKSKGTMSYVSRGSFFLNWIDQKLKPLAPGE